MAANRRLNAKLLALFKFADGDTVLEDVYPLFSAFIKENEFKELYEYSTKEPHDSLVIDATRGKPMKSILIKFFIYLNIHEALMHYNNLPNYVLFFLQRL